VSGEDDLREPDQLAGVPLPESRSSVVGHAAARAKVMAALAASRLPGGMLPHGPPRIGHATLAFAPAPEQLCRTCDEHPAHIAAQMGEEPPPETLFLLVSHKPGGLLPTIRSRCQQVALRPLPDAEVRSVLGEGPGVEHAVELAAGRPRRGFEALALGENAGLTAR